MNSRPYPGIYEYMKKCKANWACMAVANVNHSASNIESRFWVGSYLKAVKLISIAVLLYAACFRCKSSYYDLQLIEKVSEIVRIQ